MENLQIQSEHQASPDLILERYLEVNQKTYSNGAKHLYGVDSQGKQTHLSYSSILDGFGYSQDGKKLSQEPDVWYTPVESYGDQVFGPELPHIELTNGGLAAAARVSEVRERYAEVTARHRLKFFTSKRSKQEFSEATAAYERVRNSLLGNLAFAAERDGVAPSLGKRLQLQNQLEEAEALETTIVDARHAHSRGKKLHKFYDWWARQGGEKAGWKGKAKKSAVMVGVGVGTGVVLSPILGVVGVTAAGATATGLLARGVAKGLARGKFDTAGTQLTVTQAQSMSQLQKTSDVLWDDFNVAKSIPLYDLQSDIHTESVNGNTYAEIQRNRRRLIGAIALGAAGSLVGGAIATEISHYVTGWFANSNPVAGPGHPSPSANGSATSSPTPKPSPSSSPSNVPTPKPTPTTPAPTHPGSGNHHGGGNKPTSPNKPFYVERGSGIIREISEYAQSKGHHLTGQQAYQIYQAAHHQFGRQIVNLLATSHDTYMVGNDVRLSQPGSAIWFPGVEAYLNAEIEDVA